MEDCYASDAFIEILNQYGVETMFYNPGIDNAPLIESLSKYQAEGRLVPRGVLCLHEFVTMTAAHGNYMASNKPQVVLVHSELGTQQIGGALHNVQWGRIPVVFCAEPLGPDRRLNWRKEPADQGAIVRDFVKWDHLLTDDEDLRDVLHKAFKIATSEPCGPVYLTLPRDTYNRKIDRDYQQPSSEEVLSSSYKQPDPGLVDRAARLLSSAQEPLILVGYSGRHPQSVASLVALAETIGARVESSHIRMNFPDNHPLAARLDPDALKKRMSPHLSTADVILAIDYDMHYAAPPIVPKPDACIIHLDTDINKRGEPLWNRSPDIAIQADSSQAMPALTRAIRRRLRPEQVNRIRERFGRIEKEHNVIQEKWHSLAMDEADQKPISADWLCRCINEAITQDTLIVNQVITPSLAVSRQIHRTKPGTMLSCAGGSIGWALAAALGAKLAAPDKTVVSLMGDGAFVYGCPTAALWTAAFYKAPFLAIIFNNQAYAAIKGLFREKYDVENMGADIPAPPDFALIAQACRAYGRTIDDPSDLQPAINEALDQVHDGSPAVLDVRIA
jgi:acetolactate synthase-1/2/3 large subunit